MVEPKKEYLTCFNKLMENINFEDDLRGKNMDYDVVILGGGLAGCSVAAALARFNLNIAVIERNFDIAEDAAQFITTYVTDGADIIEDDTYELLKGAHEVISDLADRGNFYYKQEPSLSIFESKKGFDEMLERIQRRQIKGARPIDVKEALKYSPHIKDEYPWIIFHENTGIISPYDVATSLGEISSENGVRFRMEEEVMAIERIAHDEVRVTTDKSKYTCRVVVITAFNDLYLGSGEYRRAARDIPLQTMLLEKKFDQDIKMMMNLHHKEGYVSSVMPTFNGETLAAIETAKIMDYKEVKKEVESMIGPFPAERVDLLTITSYYDDPVVVSDFLEEKGYINLEIKNHHLPALLPKVTEMVTDLVVKNFQAGENPDFVFKRRDYFRFRDLSDKERNQAIAFDSRFGHMICTCSEVTEGEIVNAIRRPMGARSIEGVKRRTGISFGSCQGSYCLNRILKILAKELDKKPEDILNDSKESRILAARIKEFDTI